MGRTVTTARDRAAQYPNHGLHAPDNKTLLCKYCSCSVTWQKKDNIDKHVHSARHLSNQKSGMGKPMQTSLEEVINPMKKKKTETDYFAKRTVEAFCKANIPLEKLQNDALRSWINEFMDRGGELPCVKTLREKSVPLVAEDHCKAMLEALAGKKIDILCDETTDRVGRCVFVILFHLAEYDDDENQKTFVASVTFLNACDATECSRAILDALAKYEIKYENVTNIVSDSARYMGKVYDTLKVVIGDHLSHIQCWAHKINLVGSAWAAEMAELNQAVSMVKSAFLNTRKRKHLYLKYLEEKCGPEKAKLFPQPVLTRWNSWFEATFYLADYFSYIVEFFHKPEMSEISQAGINYLSQLGRKETTNIEAQAVFVKEHAKDMVDLLELMEGSNYPTAHLLYPKLEDLEIGFEELAKGHVFEKTAAALNKLSPLQRASCNDLFRKVANVALLKLRKLMEKDPSKKTFQIIAKCLNPKMILMNECSDGTELKNLIPFENLPLSEISKGYRDLKQITERELKKEVPVNMDKILRSVKIDCPSFAKCALQVLWTPTNNVDSERLISHYNNVVTDKRSSLKRENVEIFTALSFV